MHNERKYKDRNSKGKKDNVGWAKTVNRNKRRQTGISEGDNGDEPHRCRMEARKEWEADRPGFEI